MGIARGFIASLTSDDLIYQGIAERNFERNFQLAERHRLAFARSGSHKKADLARYIYESPARREIVQGGGWDVHAEGDPHG